MTITEGEKNTKKDPMLMMIEAQDKIIAELGHTLLSHTRLLNDIHDSMKDLKIETPDHVEHILERERRPYNRVHSLLNQNFTARGYEGGDTHGSRRCFRGGPNRATNLFEDAAGPGFIKVNPTQRVPWSEQSTNEYRRKTIRDGRGFSEYDFAPDNFMDFEDVDDVMQKKPMQNRMAFRNDYHNPDQANHNFVQRRPRFESGSRRHECQDLNEWEEEDVDAK